MVLKGAGKGAGRLNVKQRKTGLEQGNSVIRRRAENRRGRTNKRGRRVKS